MQLTRLYLRNYRVFEQELNLEMPAGLVGVFGVNGAGKCLPGQTLVWDGDTGERIPVERFVRDRRKRTLGLVDGEIRPVNVTDWHRLGRKPVVRIQLASGASAEFSTSHPVLTDRGCVPAGELTSTDWVAEARSLPAVAEPLLSEDEALLLGLLLGDGCLTGSVSFTAADRAVISAYTDAIERLFPGCSTRLTPKPGSDACDVRTTSTLTPSGRAARRRDLAARLERAGVPLRHYLGANAPRFRRGEGGIAWDTLAEIAEDFGLDVWADQCALHGVRALTEWARDLGILGHDAYTKHVPPRFLLLPDHLVAPVLAGLWMTDGYVSLSGPKRGSEVSFSSRSRQLAHDVRTLLLRWGVVSRFRERIVAGLPVYEVSVLSSSYERFAELPIRGPKRERLDQLIATRSTVVPHANLDLIPPRFNAGLRNAAGDGRYRSDRQLAEHAMSRRSYLAFGGDTRVAEANTMWSKVVSVEHLDRQEPCFDLTVDTRDHLYLADTIHTHNSSLLESIVFTLWGKSRTAKEDVRTTGVNGDCVAEVEFEHESHLYLVRRTITGINSTVKAEAYADNLQVATGVRDVRQYVHSVLGMDDAAFRASVFAEQKQIAAFSAQTPTARRDLVLKLLGITPLDIARDTARKDARLAREEVDRVRSFLPDLDDLRPRAEQAAAAAETAAAEAASDATAAATAKSRSTDAEKAFAAIDEVRQEHDALVREGKAARAEVDRATEQLKTLDEELAALEEADARLVPLRTQAQGLDDIERELRLVEAVEQAERALNALPAESPPPPDVDEDALAALEAEARTIATELAGVTGERKGAEAELGRAREQLERSAGLSADEDCPLCGQELGNAFDQVRTHREREVVEAEARVNALVTTETTLTKAASGVAKRLKAATDAAAKAKAARDAWAKANEARTLAARAVSDAHAALGRAPAPGELERLRADVETRRTAAREAMRLEGMLERKPVALAAKAEAESHLADAQHRRSTLLDKVHSLDFSPDKLDAARAWRDEAQAKAEAAATAAEAARATALAAAKEAEFAARQLANAEAQHAAIAERSEDARHLGRVAELMNAFRTNVVATVGPRLSAQAAELFDELTDHEYDLLRVDPETYEIRIVDAGREFGMDRFSGSETDLANLALRVAISEHVRFQSGGAVGLLVLDEVFGPLDDDRRERMLLALERLRSRFRQILVVTHTTEIKEQMPGAIEVVKLPGRRATARVVVGA